VSKKTKTLNRIAELNQIKKKKKEPLLTDLELN